MKAIAVSSAPQAIGPYSQGAVSGGFVFVSGQIAIDPATGEFSGGDIEPQTRRALANVEEVLKGAGLDRTNVVKVTVFLADIADYARMNEVYAGFFAAPHPARSAVEVAALPKNARIELDVIAAAS
jgi:2-iminobutanoate/2-iminopropanoate deaminase